jgi:hypothetical protein
MGFLFSLLAGWKLTPRAESGEAFPIFRFWVPKVANSGAAGIREGISFAPTTKSQRSAILVCYERIPKDRLSERFCGVGWLQLA